MSSGASSGSPARAVVAPCRLRQRGSGGGLVVLETNGNFGSSLSGQSFAHVRWCCRCGGSPGACVAAVVDSCAARCQASDHQGAPPRDPVPVPLFSISNSLTPPRMRSTDISSLNLEESGLLEVLGIAASGLCVSGWVHIWPLSPSQPTPPCPHLSLFSSPLAFRRAANPRIP